MALVPCTLLRSMRGPTAVEHTCLDPVLCKQGEEGAELAELAEWVVLVERRGREGHSRRVYQTQSSFCVPSLE